MEYDKSNELFSLAAALVTQTSRAVFLTGKAGTGKTTFLRYIRNNCSKQMAVVAPTGVAAINAGGVTIHSFFQLPLVPFIPENIPFSSFQEAAIGPQGLIARLRMNREKQALLRQLELLVIDEISMVRCDTLDAIDHVLRHIRNRHSEPFGGVQVLLIGDMFQLPPVVRKETWELLHPYYASPYFFDSRVAKQERPLYIEFDKIYRQNEEAFIHLLNQVRNNRLDDDGIALLESRFQPAFKRTPNDGYIVLTTHNETVNEINTSELQKLAPLSVSFRATVEGDFPENSYPADEKLELKLGAQVMFIKNDLEKTRRYYNGKIGTVTRIHEGKVYVQCGDEPQEIEVSRVKWESVRYKLNPSNHHMEEEVLGAFLQYPLRLAWAVTIHKSQGLTFEKAIIDAGKAFAGGQVYVALSRCTTLDGLVLQSRINRNSIFTDPKILEFAAECRSSQELLDELAASKRKYIEEMLLTTFDFRLSIQQASELASLVGEHEGSFNTETNPWLEAMRGKLNVLQETAERFQAWMNQQFRERPAMDTAANEALRNRIARARPYFSKELSGLIEFIQKSPATTDSRVHAREFNEQLKELYSGLAERLHLFLHEGDELDVEAWQQRRNSFVLPSFTVNVYAGVRPARIESPHPELVQQLRELRDQLCRDKDLPIYMVAASKTLQEMSVYLPQTDKDLLRISGFGKVKVESYGERFLEIIRNYCEEHGLESRMKEKTNTREAKEKKKKREGMTKEAQPPRPSTKEETLALFRSGLSVREIAQHRNRVISTIESHLAHYVQSGEIAIEELLNIDKARQIETELRVIGGESLTAVREKLGDAVTYGEIRYVKAWMAYTMNSGDNAEVDQPSS